MLKDYAEVTRYFDNAKEALSKTKIIENGRKYEDEKYVKTACGVAYNGVLKALDIYFANKDIKAPRGRKSVEYYVGNLAKQNKKALSIFDDVYRLLHLYGYYDGTTNVKVIKEGFERANELVNMLK